MKPKDIVIGKKYKHISHPNVVYMGCGNRSGKPNLQMVIIESPRFSGGSFVQKRGGISNFWEGFSPID